MLTGFDKQELIAGIFVSMIISLLFSQSQNFWEDFKNPVSAILSFISYIIVFLIELIKANIDVALRVINPSLPIKPGIVAVKTNLKSDVAKTLLANSITLTPGTLTMDVSDDKLLIHWIDVKDADLEKATREISAKFEKHIGGMFK
jgi:multicomponent Na+:H+ antiporter subunit E